MQNFAFVYLGDSERYKVSQRTAELVIAYLLAFAKLRVRAPRGNDVAIYSLYYRGRRIGEYCRNRDLIDYVVID
jgi:hypothetical protein